MGKKTALKICIIGSGRLGSTIAYAIDNEKSPEVSIVSVSSRSYKDLAAAKKLLSGSSQKILFTHDNILAAKISNCIFICTPDDEIEKTCQEIFESGKDVSGEEAKNTSTKQLSPPGQVNNGIKCLEELIVIHFSGSKKINVLDTASKAGASIACIHPLKSFTSPREAVKSLNNTLYGVTYDKADIKAKKTIDILMGMLKGRTIFVENDKKTLYHACACMASNYLVGLMDFAIDAGLEVGLDPKIFLSGLVNLSEGTLLNIKKLGTKKALTGPIARGDLSTIREHVEILKNFSREDIKEFYEIMGKRTSKIALENVWINDKTYKELIKILKK